MVKQLIAFTDAFWSVVAAVVLGFTRIIDEGNLQRKTMIWSTLGLTLYSFYWAKEYATASPRADTGVAMIIAAVLASVSGLQGYVFNAYLKSKDKESRRKREPTGPDTGPVQPSS